MVAGRKAGTVTSDVSYSFVFPKTFWNVNLGMHRHCVNENYNAWRNQECLCILSDQTLCFDNYREFKALKVALTQKVKDCRMAEG